MKNLLIALAIVFSLIAVSSSFVSAQESPIRSNIDWAVSDALEQVTLAGWAFNCRTSGQQPFSVRVRYLTDDAIPTLANATVLLRWSGLMRADVSTHFAPSCGGAEMNRFTGYTLLVGGIPSGQRALSVEWADSMGVHYTQISVDVK